MRFKRFGLTLCGLLLAIPSWGKQGSQGTSATPASDPQAVAVVQAAITALGGATAIGQAQSWTLQAQMQGPHATGTVSYVISTDADTGQIMQPDGTTRPARMIHSHFVPVLVAAVLLKESTDSHFSFSYEGAGTRDSKPVSVVRVMFSDGAVTFPAQFWSFDATNIPVLVDFRLPAEIGARQSFPVAVALSDYRSVSGVLYPFAVTTFLSRWLPQTTTLQSITVGTAAQPNEFNGKAGDLR